MSEREDSKRERGRRRVSFWRITGAMLLGASVIVSLFLLVVWLWEVASGGDELSLAGFAKFVRDSSRDLGVSIFGSIISALGSVVYFRYLMREEEVREKSDFAEQIARAVQLKAMSGVRRVPEGLSADMLKQLFQASSKTVIVETWVEDETLHKYRDELLTTLGDPEKELTFVLLHPNSPSVLRRKRDMQHLSGSGVRRKITTTLKALRHLRATAKRDKPEEPDWEPNLHVYCHDCLPAVQLYMTPQIAYVGLYLQGVASSDGIQLEVEFPSKVGEFLKKHVKNLLSCDNAHLLKVDLTAESEEAFLSQFNQSHLECQLEDIADQILNLSASGIATFTNRLNAALSADDSARKRERLRSFIKASEAVIAETIKGDKLAPSVPKAGPPGSARRPSKSRGKRP